MIKSDTGTITLGHSTAKLEFGGLRVTRGIFMGPTVSSFRYPFNKNLLVTSKLFQVHLFLDVNYSRQKVKKKKNLSTYCILHLAIREEQMIIWYLRFSKTKSLFSVCRYTQLRPVSHASSVCWVQSDGCCPMATFLGTCKMTFPSPSTSSFWDPCFTGSCDLEITFLPFPYKLR